MTSHPVAARVLSIRNMLGMGFSYTELKTMSAKEMKTWKFVIECEGRRRKLDKLIQESKLMGMK